MATPSLSDTSCAVLGLLDMFGPTTPYRLKQIAQLSIFHFWSIPHTQLYTECGRLAEAGFLEEEREESGRRRRVYRLNAKGRKALRAWRADPTADPPDVRVASALKLFFGADPAALAETQLEQHQQLLGYLEVLKRPDVPEGVRLCLEAGIGHEREYVRFWTRLLDEGRGKR